MAPAAAALAARVPADAEPSTESQLALSHGTVVVKYSMYAEEFPLRSGGVLTAKEIDEKYCLSDAMPGCEIHLADAVGALEKYARGEAADFVEENPPGTFRGLLPGKVYFCCVIEDAAELARSQDRARRAFGSTAAPSLVGLDQYTAAFKEVFDKAKAEGAGKGLEGEMLTVFVLGKVDQFNSA